MKSNPEIYDLVLEIPVSGGYFWHVFSSSSSSLKIRGLYEAYKIRPPPPRLAGFITIRAFPYSTSLL